MKLANPIEVFLNSLDSTEDWQGHPGIKITEEFTLHTVINSKLWDDGAPVLKYFDRDPQTASYTFEPGETVEFIESHYSGSLYWFKNGIWYRAAESLSELEAMHFIGE